MSGRDEGTEECILFVPRGANCFVRRLVEALGVQPQMEAVVRLRFGPISEDLTLPELEDSIGYRTERKNSR